MRSTSRLWRIASVGGLLACTALAACAEAEKTGATKALIAPATASKAGPSMAMRAGEAATSLGNGEAQKGVAAITPGQTARGTLAASDGKMDNGAFVDVWTFDVAQPSEVVIALTSTAFDTYLALADGPPGSATDILAMNDDLLGTNSGIAISVQPGTYGAMATSYAGGATGDYEITVAILSSGSDEARVLRPGSPVSGNLTSSDETLPDGSYYHGWTLQGQAGDRVTVSLQSSDFDTYVAIQQGSEVLAFNDDADGTTNSRAEATLPASGAYTVVATSFTPGDTGAYTLTAQSEQRPPFVGFRSGGDPNGRYALLIGIGDYPGTENDLGNAPIEDANIMRRMLVDHFGFDPANVLTLNDADATRENIAQGVAQHLGQAGPNGVAFLYYSGHGTQMGQNIGVTGSLDPENAEGDQAIYVYGADYESSVILDEELGYLIETIDAGRAMVALDNCYSGTGTRGPANAPQPKKVDAATVAQMRMPTHFITSELKALNLTDLSLGFGDFGRIAQVMENPQTHVMWGASTDEQVSWTSSLGGGSSVFTYYLGERLTAAPGTTTLAQVHRQVSEDVVGYINSEGNMTMQNPQIRGDRQSMTVAEFFRQR